MKVLNKVIVVTGGGSGMGREIVLNLLSKGARVITVDINEMSLQETNNLAGDKQAALSTFVLNITDRVAVEEFFKTAVQRYGIVDGIINNAGIIQPFFKLNDLSYEVIQRVIDVNFFGTLYMVKTFLPHLLTRPEAHIVNVSSMGGFMPFPGQTIYGASKAAVKLLTEGLNSELSDTKVRTTVVFPGAVVTNIMENSGINSKPSADTKSRTGMLLSASEAAEIIVSGVEKNKAQIFAGKDSNFMNLFYRIAPERAAKFICSKMKQRA